MRRLNSPALLRTCASYVLELADEVGRWEFGKVPHAMVQINQAEILT
jgi:hypothetical protein